MLKHNIIEILITGYNIKHYTNIGYNCEREELEIKTTDLPKGSHTTVECICDYCGSENIVVYKNYFRNTQLNGKYCCKNQECVNQKIKDVCNIKYGVDNPFQDENVKEKSKQTLLSKHGVEHPMYMKETKDKIKATCLEKYNVDNISKLPEYRNKAKLTTFERYGVEYLTQDIEYQKRQKEKRISNGTQKPDDNTYECYRRIVDNLTEIKRKILFENWDGYDYYEIDDFIKDNVDNKNRPSIDHKTPVMFGYYNNIPPELIADISNLCITKVSLNCQKLLKNEVEFRSFLENKKSAD